ncbi:penicillin-binding protein 1C [Salmonella enterica subsp. enterica serovar Adelaide str. A4-669]|uniref:Penicillin-binding protein 1C n=1 Tax=Salmonella enterica subsp. enterica serovar Adelaide str. A4-669 TaxID=913063 RepID=A0A6C8GJY6_SALET|nr:penicillin-binding protein 1C [Salmonella enterica subsp. enterica serovar Adelaide str. A4-669]
MNGWRGKRGRWLWLAGAPLFIFLALWAADKLWPLPLNEVHPARVVVAHDGTPLWRFADAGGIWRYPVTIEEVSPRYLEALINYEDRWFWRHPGVNPFSVARAARHGRILPPDRARHGRILPPGALFPAAVR